MANIIYPFAYNNNETEPEKRFPSLSGSSFSFNISINDLLYVVRVTYNIWTNNAMVSVIDSADNKIIIDTPLIKTFEDMLPNFLVDNLFAGYFLVWDPDQGGFVFGETQ